MQRRVFGTPPPDVKRDFDSLLDWVRSQEPKMPLREAKRVAYIQAVRAGAEELKAECLDKMWRDG